MSRSYFFFPLLCLFYWITSVPPPYHKHACNVFALCLQGPCINSLPCTVYQEGRYIAIKSFPSVITKSCYQQALQQICVCTECSHQGTRWRGTQHPSRHAPTGSSRPSPTASACWRSFCLRSRWCRNGASAAPRFWHSSLGCSLTFSLWWVHPGPSP